MHSDGRSQAVANRPEAAPHERQLQPKGASQIGSGNQARFRGTLKSIIDRAISLAFTAEGACLIQRQNLVVGSSGRLDLQHAPARPFRSPRCFFAKCQGIVFSQAYLRPAISSH